MALTFKERMSIAKHQGKLVKKAEDLYRDCKMWNSKLEENQLRNVADMAMNEQCVPVIINFIKYQRGRKSDEWNYNDFGEKVIKIINDFETEANGMVEEQQEGKTDEIWIELCRSFWAYLIRYAKFQDKVKGEEK